MPASSTQLSPNYRRYNQTRRYVKDVDDEVVEFNEEREEEEYVHVLQRSPSTASDTATIQFLTDDRLEPTVTQRRVNRRWVRDEDEREDRWRTEIIEASARSSGRAKDDWNNNNLQVDLNMCFNLLCLTSNIYLPSIIPNFFHPIPLLPFDIWNQFNFIRISVIRLAVAYFPFGVASFWIVFVLGLLC